MEVWVNGVDVFRGTIVVISKECHLFSWPSKCSTLCSSRPIHFNASALFGSGCLDLMGMYPELYPPLPKMSSNTNPLTRIGIFANVSLISPFIFTITSTEHLYGPNEKQHR
jgi:hypothetical protein